VGEAAGLASETAYARSVGAAKTSTAPTAASPRMFVTFMSRLLDPWMSRLATTIHFESSPVAATQFASKTPMT